MSTILISEPHVFYFDEQFHPERKGQIAQHGWHAVARYEHEGHIGYGEAYLGLNRQGTEASAVELAQWNAITNYQRSLFAAYLKAKAVEFESR